MFPQIKNSIGNLSFQLLYNGSADGMEVKQTTEHIVDHQFLPALEQLLDKHSTADEVITIDKMECNITIGGSELNDALVKKIMAQLEKQLLDRGTPARDGDVKPLSLHGRYIKTLLFYLKNGRLPWWATIASKKELNEMVLNLAEAEVQSADSNELLILLRTENVVLRICNDLEDETFWEVLKLMPFYSRYISAIETWKKDYIMFTAETYLSSDSIYFPLTYKKNILKAFAAIGTPALAGQAVELNELFANFLATEELRHLPVELINKISDPVLKARLKFIEEQKRQIDQQSEEKNNVKSNEDPETNQQKKKPKAEDEEGDDNKLNLEALYINNSGLVIIASYLGMFFNKLGLVRDGKITDTTRAVTLLHYITSGNTAFAEFEVILPKLLCGVDIKDAVKSKYEITAGDAEEVDGLLKAVIANWTVLKNTSPDGLRSAFLMRDGKLSFKGNSYHLQVQEQAIDVLMQHLPWNISMIKLSWMKHLLIVDWM